MYRIRIIEVSSWWLNFYLSFQWPIEKATTLHHLLSKREVQLHSTMHIFFCKHYILIKKNMTRYCWVLTPTDSAIKVYCMTNTVTVSRTQWSVDKEQDTIQRHITHTPHATQGKLQSRQPQEMKTSARRRTPPLPATGKGVNDKFHRVSGRTGWRWDQQLRGMGRVQLSRTAAVFANSTYCITVLAPVVFF